jgi:hypothetical protein
VSDQITVSAKYKTRPNYKFGIHFIHHLLETLQAEAMEAQSMRDRKHVFFSKKQKLGGNEGAKDAASAAVAGGVHADKRNGEGEGRSSAVGSSTRPGQQQQRQHQQPPQKAQKAVLSFADDEEGL